MGKEADGCQGLGKQEARRVLSEYPLSEWLKFLDLDRGVTNNPVNMINVTKLVILKWLIFYVSFNKNSSPPFLRQKAQNPFFCWSQKEAEGKTVPELEGCHWSTSFFGQRTLPSACEQPGSALGILWGAAEPDIDHIGKSWPQKPVHQTRAI